MIDYEKLGSIAESLSQYRGDGRSRILFDSRDRGNYGDWNWNDTAAMLREFDPTGLAVGMLLNEMLEATINGSRVRLSSVLREAGFVEQLRDILLLKTELDQLVADPMTALLDRLEASLREVSADFGRPSSREAAICLRDAIYSMSKGLTLRWLQLDASAEDTGPVRLNPEIPRYPDVASFTRALRQDIPFGAHLARIGHDHTVIGIRRPGKTAYLSSMTINIHRGTMDEQRANGYHMAEDLDLDKAVERYPDWTAKPATEHYNAGAQPVPHGRDAHALDHISKLPRDRLIWLAMIVEMASQQMGRTSSTDIQLTESLELALPAPLPGRAGLPVVFQPNWTADELTLSGMLESLNLAPWETAFLRPALDGLTEAAFLPLTPLRIRLDTLETIECPEESGAGASYFDRRTLEESSVLMQRASAEWVGTKAEIDAARRTLFGTNLVKWLLAWGNRRFDQEWNLHKEWMKSALQHNLPQAIAAAGCARRKDPEFRLVYNVDLYSQSPKHKTYNPRCVFDPKSAVTDIAHFVPKTSGDIVEMLGLSSEADLPSFLQGWSRVQSWTTSDPHANWRPGGAADTEADRRTPPYPTLNRWCFSQPAVDSGRRHYIEAIVQFNRKNCKDGAAALAARKES